MKRVVMLVAALCLVGVGGVAWAVDGGSNLGATNAHNLSGPQGTCSKCHIPHGGKGDKIWARALTGLTNFSGIHTLCESCHFVGNGAGITSGVPSVFTKWQYQNHSMLGWANIATGSAVVPGGSTIFPISMTDTDTIWTATSLDTPADSNQGFYCGSCHNPHKQPYTVINGHGDYLRVATASAVASTFTLFGSSMARQGACTQCHPTQSFTGTQNSSGHNAACSLCHNPHRGGDVATNANALIAEKILTVSGATSPFTAPPNVPGFTAASYAALMAGVCYNCHSTVGAGRLTNSSGQIFTSLEHHPMGTNAPTAADGEHAPGYTATFGTTELTCTGCHNPHNGAQDFYLSTAAGTYAGTGTDDGDFCITVCHNDKTVTRLGASNTAHLWTKAASPITMAATWLDEGGNGQGECFMCHSIHDGPSRADTELPQLNALMRVAAINMNRARQAADADTLDYEDLCNGCHSVSTRVNGTVLGTGGAYLTFMAATPSYFTHLFSGTASADVTTNMTAASLPMAPATKTTYGAVTGQIFCGTCHNVHEQSLTDAQGQMFVQEHWGAGGQGQLCTDCHGVQPIYQGTAGGGSHPIRASALLPTTGITAPTTNSQYGSGGNGAPNGRTTSGTPGTGPAASDTMECETCHNFHTSITNRMGSTTGDATGTMGKLMIMNNSASGLCSTCHTNY